jgi:hypothetical protein
LAAANAGDERSMLGGGPFVAVVSGIATPLSFKHE